MSYLHKQGSFPIDSWNSDDYNGLYFCNTTSQKYKNIFKKQVFLKIKTGVCENRSDNKQYLRTSELYSCSGKRQSENL